jgi:hypothetical protein
MSRIVLVILIHHCHKPVRLMNALKFVTFKIFWNNSNIKFDSREGKRSCVLCNPLCHFVQNLLSSMLYETKNN